MTPARLQCEYLTEPRGVDSAAPRLGWICTSRGAGSRGERQTAYQVLVASASELLAQDRGDLWDTARVVSGRSSQVVYAGAPLRSWQVCHWKVRIWDGQDRCSAWSAPASWRLGVLRPEDWRARWILCPAEGPAGGAATGLCPWFRQTFHLADIPPHAVAGVSSVGYHELYLNGRKVGDEVLAPSVSNLRKRVLYLTHEIAPYLRRGENAVAIWVAPGWSEFCDANPPVDFQLEQKPLCLAQLNFGDALAPVCTDETWRCTASNTRHLGRWQNSDFGGDRVDARIAMAGWSEVDFDDSTWLPAVAADLPGRELSADLLEPNRLSERIIATELSEPEPGRYRFTMAQLFAGWIELKVHGRAGTTIVIQASSLAGLEVEYNQRNEYIIGPSGSGVFCHRFSYHLYQFVMVDGLEGAPALSDLVGYRVSNERARIGEFDCSNPLLQQIYEITSHTYQNLCTGGMTVDCPHRERLGYGGDAHDSMDFALDTFASAAFLTKWARDWCDIQDANGRINHTAPTYGGGGGPSWSGFMITMPWEVYVNHGDRRILERIYPYAQKWLAYLETNMGGDGLLGPVDGGEWAYWEGKRWLFLGDWIAPTCNEASETPEALLFNNCYYLHVLNLMAAIANLVGQDDDAPGYRARAAQLRAALIRRFYDPASHCFLDRKQTHCVLPLISGAVPANAGEAVAQNLADEILTTCRGHLDTGMHGTYFLTKYLVESGRNDLIFTYATQMTYPSYGELIAHGYTSWPETWGGAESRLHGCLNGIGLWFQRGLAGINPDPAEPGYRHVIIKPGLAGDLSWVTGSHDSPLGLIVSSWRRDGASVTLEVQIPPNATATVHLPKPGSDARLLESNQPLALAEGVKILHEDAQTAVCEVGSGYYVFRAELAGASSDDAR